MGQRNGLTISMDAQLSAGSAIVSDDQTSDDVEPADRDARQLTERVVIARHRPFHEFPLHPGSSGGAT